MQRSVRRLPTFLLGAVLAAALGGTVEAASTKTAGTVLELFTSQGCSSCPAADALAGKLAAKPDLILLSLPIDYWDYLGWKDTFAQHAFSERQRAYAKARGDGQVYTPQMVVDGLQHAVGAELVDIEQAIGVASKALAGKKVPVTMSPTADGVTVSIGAAPVGSASRAGTLLLADFTTSQAVDIKRGENGGRQVTYIHIVRSLQPVGTWSGGAETVHLSREQLMAEGADGCAVLLQADEHGPILGAAQMIGW